MVRLDATLFEAVRERAHATLTVVYCLTLALTLSVESEAEAAKVVGRGRWLKFGRAVIDFLV